MNSNRILELQFRFKNFDFVKKNIKQVRLGKASPKPRITKGQF